MFNREKLVLETVHIRKREFIEQPKHIVYAADQNYIKHIGTALLSVLQNNTGPIHFHLLVSGSEGYDFNIFNQIETSNQNYAISVYHLNTEYFSTLQTTHYFTIAMYYRMSIPCLLKGIAHTALYLDTDVLCLGNIDDLFEIDISNSLIAAVPDAILYRAYIKQLNQFGFTDTEPYFNSGVILFNIDKWNDMAIDKILSEKMQAVEKQNFKLSCPDQDILNLACIGHVHWLSENFNWIHWHQKYSELIDNPNNIRLVHFVGHIKPWHQLGFHPAYDQYFKNSPWNNGYLEQPLSTWLPFPNPKRKFRQAAKRLWKQGQKKQAWAYYKEYLLRRINKRRYQAPSLGK